MASVAILIFVDVARNKADVPFGFILIALFLIIAFLVLFIKLRNILVHVEIDDSGINFLLRRGKTKYKWKELSEITFTWIGLYRITDFDQNTFYFPPSDLEISFFGNKLNMDEFDELIEKKKRELGI